jgi:hypothetical protein
MTNKAIIANSLTNSERSEEPVLSLPKESKRSDATLCDFAKLYIMASNMLMANPQ